MRLPPKKRPGDPILARDWNLLIEALEFRTPRPSHGIELVFTSSGFSYRTRQGSSESVIPKPPCPFGSLVSLATANGSVRAIRGGVVHCGDQNFVIADRQTPTNDGDWLAYLTVNCEVNRDDDGTILLPGVKTGSAPSGIEYAASSLPGGTNPDAGSGQGTVILSVGLVRVENGSPRFSPDGCGNFRVEHCAGTLSYSRI
jgi:hypothetical protein